MRVRYRDPIFFLPGLTDENEVVEQRPEFGSIRPGRTVTLFVERVPDCTPGYSPCLPPAIDYDCGGGEGNGPEYVWTRMRVTGTDPYDLDDDGDGYGCDSLG